MRASDPDESMEHASGGNIAWACRQLALWGGVAFALYLAIGFRSLWLPLGPPTAPPVAGAPAVPSAPPAAQSVVATGALTFRANRQGHVLLDAAVNGATVRFIVDTGATLVVLSARDAAAAGIARHELKFTGRASTANGTIRTAPVKLREVRVEQMSLSDVEAAVVENLDTSLLGMSFLKRLRSYEMRDGALTISW